jgi:hypothetical protein
LFRNNIILGFYLFCFLAFSFAATADTPRSRDAVYKIVKGAKTFGPRGYGYTFKSLDKLSERLTAADAPALLTLLQDSDAATGASFGLAALCGDGLSALSPAIDNDPRLPLDRARDILNTVQRFPKCTAEDRSTAEALNPRIDAAFEKRQAHALAAQKAAQEELEQHNRRQLKQLDPDMRKTLSAEERAQILEENTRAIGLDGPRTPEQEILYQKMKQTLMGPSP